MFNCELHLGRRRASGKSASRGLPWIVLALLAFVVLQAGCTSLNRVPLTSSGRPTAPLAVKVGDQVRVFTRRGEKIEFQVTAIDPDAVGGKGLRVLNRDIARLEVRRPDKGRTFTLTASLVGGAATIAGIIWIIHNIAFMAGP